MFKKIIVFICWLVFVLFLFAVSAVFCVWQGLSSVFMVGGWLALIVIVLGSYTIYRLVSQLQVGHTLRRKFFSSTKSRAGLALYRYLQEGRIYLQKTNRQQPWFLVLGNQCGKSRWLSTLDTLTPITMKGSGQSFSQRSLTWWVSKQSIYLEISAFLLSKQKNIQQVWQHLLKWIGLQRKPAGIILCVSADELSQNNSQIIYDSAMQISEQLSLLRTAIKVDIPVYIVVTQLDKLVGFSQWYTHLTDVQKQYPLGYIWKNTAVLGSEEERLYPAFDTMSRVITLSQFGLFSVLDPVNLSVELLSFPEEFKKLFLPCTQYLAHLSSGKKRISAINLRAIWCTSNENDTLTSHSMGGFSHQLINKTLPELGQCYQNEQKYHSQWHLLTSLVITIIFIFALFESYKLSDQILSEHTYTTNSDLTHSFWKQDALVGWNKLSVFPFLPVINKQLQWDQMRLLSRNNAQRVDIQAMLAEYKAVFLVSPANKQRQMILSLVDAYQFQQALMDKQPLQQLANIPFLTPDLQWIKTASPLLPMEQIALYQAAYQVWQPKDIAPALSSLLGQLILSAHQQGDHWLLTYEDPLNNIDLSKYLPFIPSQKYYLPARYTAQGEAQIHCWINRVISTLHVNEGLFSEFFQQYHQQRQDEWKKLLLNMVAVAPHSLDEQLWQKIDIDLSQGHSPYRLLLSKMFNDLSSINDIEQQDWLKEAKLLSRLQQSSNLTGGLATLSFFNRMFRSKIGSYMQRYQNNYQPGMLPPQASTYYVEWQKAFQKAVSAMLSEPFVTNKLTEGLFSQSAKEDNALLLVNQKMMALGRFLTQEGYILDNNVVWQFFQAEDSLLIEQSMQRSALWLQQQWQKNVLLPLEREQKLDDYNVLQQAFESDLQNFVQHVALKGLVEENNQLVAAHWQQIAMPLMPEFVALANQIYYSSRIVAFPDQQLMLLKKQLFDVSASIEQLTAQQTALKNENIPLMIVSEPATANTEAQLLPIGTQLNLQCQGVKTAFNSANIMNTLNVDWKLGTCQQIDVAINFPHFTLYHHYSENNPFVQFLNDYSSNEHDYSLSELQQGNNDENVNTTIFNHIGINHIIVRYKIMPTENIVKINQIVNDYAALQQKLMSMKLKQSQLTQRLNLMNNTQDKKIPLTSLMEKIILS